MFFSKNEREIFTFLPFVCRKEEVKLRGNPFFYVLVKWKWAKRKCSIKFAVPSFMLSFTLIEFYSQGWISNFVTNVVHFSFLFFFPKLKRLKWWEQEEILGLFGILCFSSFFLIFPYGKQISRGVNFVSNGAFFLVLSLSK